MMAAAAMADCEVTDESNDPGAAPFGNFINYYAFNPPENRMSLIPSTLLQDIGYSVESSVSDTVLLLDVGCNSGDLSVALFTHLQGRRASDDAAESRKLHLLGVDLDEDLILRAEQSNPFPENISFIPLDITHDLDSRTQLESYLARFGRSRFHLCACLAVTMWVHLNHGDAALLDLLTRLASFSDHLLLEAQPWKCYRSAARRLRKLGRRDFDHFKTLEIRGDITERAKEHLERSCGMELLRSFGSTVWDRKLLLFGKRKMMRGEI
ncbi:pre-miRNA 5'-monophosphate methyltransferase [Conger conger]|uniref:pre-miRNA 5'-monophosphate methyltransferase n=1 Tax=Conger conger TaxID=82655 RepID=UPI002A5B06BB|nr:pre-miRNA 5'-monophosphate methyltransferase [Conger conger]